MMHKLTAMVVTLFLSECVCAQTILKIAGQEGGERFFPLISAIYKQIGVEVEFTLLPSERALSSVNAGNFAAEVGRIRDTSGKYPNLEYSTESLLDVHLVAMIKKGSKITLLAPEDLRKYRVGYVIGMSVAESYNSQHELKAFSVATHDQLAQMLESNRLDVALMGTAFITSPVYQVGEEIQVLSTASVYHMFNKQFAHLAPQFDKVLRAMKMDGRYEKLLPGPTR